MLVKYMLNGVEITENAFNTYLDSGDYIGKSTMDGNVKIFHLVRPDVSLEMDALKRYLSGTDYMVIKIAEAETDEEKSALRTEYADMIANRQTWRTQIQQLIANTDTVTANVGTVSETMTGDTVIINGVTYTKAELRALLGDE